VEIYTSPNFEDDLKKLIRKNVDYSQKLQKTVKLLRQNINYPSLRLHKLEGRKCFSISVDMSIRIIFSIKGNRILLEAIGTHDDVY